MTRRYRIANVAMGLDEDAAGAGAGLAARIAGLLGLPGSAVSDCRVVRRALDARRRAAIHHVCTVECAAGLPAPEPLAAGVTPIEGSSLDIARPDALPLRAPNGKAVRWFASSICR